MKKWEYEKINVFLNYSNSNESVNYFIRFKKSYVLSIPTFLTIFRNNLKIFKDEY